MGPVQWAATALVILALAPLDARRDTAAWPQFRGPGGTGVLDGARLPTSWSAKTGVAWSVDLPGRGWSSPIAWDDQVFVTAAISPGTFKEPSPGIYGNDYAAELTKKGFTPEQVLEAVRQRDIERTQDTGEIRYMIYSVDAETGRVRWEREAHKGQPFGGRHRKNTYASETPSTDGARVYAYFGNVGLFAYTLDGTLRGRSGFRRSRCTSTSALPPLPSSTTAKCSFFTTTTDSRLWLPSTLELARNSGSPNGT